MTPTEINIAVAESAGWRFLPHQWYTASGTEVNGWKLRSPAGELSLRAWGGKEHAAREGLPNYYDSLDAIVPVVRAMPGYEFAAFALLLASIAAPNYAKEDCWAAQPHVCATSDQWCEAYLRAKGL